MRHQQRRFGPPSTFFDSFEWQTYQVFFSQPPRGIAIIMRKKLLLSNDVPTVPWQTNDEPRKRRTVFILRKTNLKLKLGSMTMPEHTAVGGGLAFLPTLIVICAVLKQSKNISALAQLGRYAFQVYDLCFVQNKV